MLRKLSLIAVLVLLAVSATIVFAAVTFDPATGTGFGGKGDVQNAFGWNNRQLQANAGNVSFVYVTETTYEVTTEWSTLSGGKKETEVKPTRLQKR